MTTAMYKTPDQIQALGFRALVERLGPGGALAFMHHYERGEGNYVAERKRLLRDFRLEDLRVRRGRRR